MASSRVLALGWWQWPPITKALPRPTAIRSGGAISIPTMAGFWSMVISAVPAKQLARVLVELHVELIVLSDPPPERGGNFGRGSHVLMDRRAEPPAEEALESLGESVEVFAQAERVHALESAGGGSQARPVQIDHRHHRRRGELLGSEREHLDHVVVDEVLEVAGIVVDLLGRELGMGRRRLAVVAQVAE